MMLEVIRMIPPSLQGIETGDWNFQLADMSGVQDKAALLQAWDEADAFIEARWAHLTREALRGVVPPLPHLRAVPYLVDNEIHHRAQGFIYLRLLGVEPPAFFERRSGRLGKVPPTGPAKVEPEPGGPWAPHGRR